jgi:hypothetical protein
MRKVFLLMALLISIFPVGLKAQEDSIQIGIQAFQDLDFLEATQILNPLSSDMSIPGDLRITALNYLGATNVFLGRVSAAENAYRRLLTEDPMFRPDQLVFPPEVTAFFEDVRRGTRVVHARLDEDIEVDVGRESVLLDVVASSQHSVIVEVHYASATALETVQDVYTGVVGETHRITWDPGEVGLDRLMNDSVWLSIASLSPDGVEERRLVIPLGLTITRSDTIAHPVFPAENILPERGPRRRGPALLAGVVGGAVLGLASSIASPGAQLSEVRYAIAGGIGLAAVIGLINPPPGRLIPANIEANRLQRERRQELQGQLDRVLAENKRLRAEATLTVRPAAQVLSETISR